MHNPYSFVSVYDVTPVEFIRLECRMEGCPRAYTITPLRLVQHIIEEGHTETLIISGNLLLYGGCGWVDGWVSAAKSVANMQTYHVIFLMISHDFLMILSCEAMSKVDRHII